MIATGICISFNIPNTLDLIQHPHMTQKIIIPFHLKCNFYIFSGKQRLLKA